MEECNAIERELLKVERRFSGFSESAQKTIDELIDFVKGLQSDIDASDGDLPPTHIEAIGECVGRMKSTTDSIAKDHKELHVAVSRVGKNIDKHFVADYNGVIATSFFEHTNTTTLINRVICEHFLRMGMLDIAEQLMSETGLQMGDDEKQPFIEMHSILKSLQERDLGPAFEWVKGQTDKEFISLINSDLDFYLHRLQFILMVSDTEQKYSVAEILQYARKLAKCPGMNLDQLQQLMGSLLYLKNGLKDSPYEGFLDEQQWTDVKEMFTKAACASRGLANESPLAVCLQVGCQALPPLLNIRQIIEQRLKGGQWSSKDELPIEIPLNREHQYHSVFACPILRQQTTHTNPPMRLACGHVISKDALSRLTNQNKVKCPYCPNLQTPSEAREIFL